jgi:segregation and condensation protein A
MDEVSTIYKVKTASFEGPLDLLLSLIENRKLFVNEISLAQVTNDYISYVKEIKNDSEEKNIADISYFILIAATLILIKSRSLLPTIELTEDENEKIVDLEKRLLLYQIFKDASLNVKNNFGKNIIFMPNEKIWNEPIFSPDSQITLSNINQSMLELLNNLPEKKEKLPEIEVKKVINIEEIINNLTDRIQNAINLSFKDFIKNQNLKDEAEAKVHIIVSFLAMLELVREGVIDVIQNNSFDDISINKQPKEEVQNI